MPTLACGAVAELAMDGAAWTFNTMATVIPPAEFEPTTLNEKVPGPPGADPVSAPVAPLSVNQTGNVEPLSKTQEVAGDPET